jgi:hypothetical protein
MIHRFVQVVGQQSLVKNAMKIGKKEIIKKINVHFVIQKTKNHSLSIK